MVMTANLTNLFEKNPASSISVDPHEEGRPSPLRTFFRPQEEGRTLARPTKLNAFKWKANPIEELPEVAGLPDAADDVFDVLISKITPRFGILQLIL
jgi:hypothetical protein